MPKTSAPPMSNDEILHILKVLWKKYDPEATSSLAASKHVIDHYSFLVQSECDRVKASEEDTMAAEILKEQISTETSFVVSINYNIP